MLTVSNTELTADFPVRSLLMAVLPERPARFPVSDIGSPILCDDEPAPTAAAEVRPVKIKLRVAGEQALIPDGI